MKELLKIAGIFAFFVIGIPMLGLLTPYAEESNSEIGYEVSPVTEEQEEKEAVLTEEMFRVLDHTSGQVMEMTVFDYVKGAVMAEMPASYNTEALKAQAVAAHTYAVRREKMQKESPDPELMGAYISNDSTKYQAYFTEAQARAFYGDAYDEYEKKISAAVSEVIDEILVYEDEPIIAAFHAVSCGKTESAENVWGSGIDYLIPAESEEDKNAPTYFDEKEFPFAELEARLSAAYDTDFSGEKEELIKISETSPSGTVIKVLAGGKILSGTELRTLLNLRSACFDVKYDKGNDVFIFTTKGSGHGVGMSQYGANAMAENGSNYRDILLHYYPGTEIVKVMSDEL